VFSVESFLSLFKVTPERNNSYKAKVEAEMKLLHRLELFVPQYYGIVEYVPDPSAVVGSGSFGTNYNTHILLHNLVARFSKPCVVDLKMGTQTFEPDAPSDKKIRERTKYPLQKEFGFRIVAMRVYDPSNVEASADGYIVFPKKFGRSLETRDSVKRALRTFFGGSKVPKEVLANRSAAIKAILTKLKLIKRWFTDNNIFSFCASSILLIYEGETVTNDVDGVQLDMATAKMIDFGRVRRRPGGDPGYLKGLRTLISLLEEILRESFWTEEYDYLE
jgi:1D-myo-inositol-tetrakisphosphate 5-kinase/inositol-polyphosphate multikinase